MSSEDQAASIPDDPSVAAPAATTCPICSGQPEGKVSAWTRPDHGNGATERPVMRAISPKPPFRSEVIETIHTA